MDFHKILLKIAYWLVAISIVVLIGFTFFARHLVKQSQTAQIKNTETEESTNIEISGMSMTIDNEVAKKEVAEIREAMKKDEEGRRGKQ